MIRKNKIIAVIICFLLCLNVFCLNTVCAYDNFNLQILTKTDTSSKIQDFDGANSSDSCLDVCCGHCCVCHHLYISEKNTPISVKLETEKLFYFNEVPFYSAFLESIPKPPSSYSFI